VARDLPVLAICRGHQVLNVATGGTLIQDIPSEVGGGVAHDPPRRRWTRSHEIDIVDGTRLHQVLQRTTIFVNSFHHQAIDRLGEGLVVSARSAGDRLVEAVELPDRRFVLGVQWHPESFWDRADGFQALFSSFVSMSRN
jgi:putative glutamine amidotransferase